MFTVLSLGKVYKIVAKTLSNNFLPISNITALHHTMPFLFSFTHFTKIIIENYQFLITFRLKKHYNIISLLSSSLKTLDGIFN